MEITIRARKITVADMESLEELGLIQRLLPPEASLRAGEGKAVAVDIYQSAPEFGGHKLLFINMNLLQGKLNYHPDHEDVLLINAGHDVKPCIFVFGLSKREIIEKKAKAGQLSAADFAAYIIPFNDPQLSFFTVKAGTAHHEMTTPGPQQSPYFWVSEPTDLPLCWVDMGPYQLKTEVD